METWRLAAIGSGWLLVAVYAFGSGYFVDNSGWYRSLNQPSWQPPDWVFGLIWPYHFICLALGMYALGNEASATLAWGAIAWFAVTVFTALAWSYEFYRPHRLKRAAWYLTVTALLTPAFVWAVAQVSSLNALLLAPYVVWLCVAASLSFGYAKLNG